ncbi:hypothetical protein ARMGADRAFT_462931 [Armillaria gallica]|uniref:Uncharacterized protein n=1 Tax=Armillaria gallica TaxID=47427 RepID=A0A2H3CZM6_ARMGA|nr:hypothetical protein ARMGADRAFT_462931 [Armillaria gallica]
MTTSEDWVVAHLHNPLDARRGNRLLEKNVRTIYGMLMEWLLPETMPAIPNPP